MSTNLMFSAAAGLLLMLDASPAASQAAAPPASPPAAAVPAGQPVPSKMANELFTALDANKDGVLSRQEFQQGYPGMARAVVLELRLREQFAAMDADKSGSIEAGEYARLELVKRAGKSAPAMADFDANKDQKLEFAEYLAVVRRLAASPAPESN